MKRRHSDRCKAPGSVLAGCAGVLLSLLVTQSPKSACAEELIKVKVGDPGSLLHLPYFVALEQGFFKKQGLEIDDISTFNWVPALLNGDLDFACAVSDGIIIAAAHGRPIPAIVMEQQKNTVSISASTRLALPNLAKGYPENMRDLKGKALSVPNLGTGNESLIRQSFSAIGFENGRDYSIVVLGAGPNMIAALKADKIDAVTLWPPYSEEIWAEKLAVPLVQEGKGEGPESNAHGAGEAMAVNPRYAKAHPDVVKKFVAAMVEADAYVRDSKNNMSRLIEIANMHHAGVSDRAIMEAAVQTVANLAYPGVDRHSWELVAQGLKSINAIESIPNYDMLVDGDVAPPGPLGPSN